MKPFRPDELSRTQLAALSNEGLQARRQVLLARRTSLRPYQDTHVWRDMNDGRENANILHELFRRSRQEAGR